MERDYRVTYRSQEADPRDVDRYDAPRRRIPTALDPYLYPEDRDELKRNVAEVKLCNANRHAEEYGDYDRPSRREVHDDVSKNTVRGTTKPETTKTTYSVTSAGLEKESETTSRVPIAARVPPPVDPAPIVSRRERRERDDYEASPPSIRTSGRPYGGREYAPMEGDYEVLRPRREGGGYVVDMRDADVIDVYSPNSAREADRGFAGYRGGDYDDPPRNTYSRGPPARDYNYRPRMAEYGDRDGRSSAPSLHDDGPYMSGARADRAPTALASRSQASIREAPSRASARIYEEDLPSRAPRYGASRAPTRQDEDEWGFIERTTTRDARDDFPRDTPRGRGRASTVTKPPPEADYVMVSPPREDAATAMTARSGAGAQSMRSAMFNESSYTPEERLRRRRSRSISFRDEEARGHDRGEGKFYERPGAEAAMMGKYLNKYDVEDDRMDYAYSSRSRREPRERDYEYDRRDRDDATYAPQRMRSRSRRRRDDEENDYTSTYKEKTTKTTYY